MVCVRGRFRAPFPFAPAHNRRKSAQSTVQFPVSGAFAVDNRGRRWFTWRSLQSWATHASPLHRYAPDGSGTACRVAFHGSRSRSSAATIICVSSAANLWFGSTVSMGGRGRQSGWMVVHLEVFANLGEACLAPTQICPLLDRYGVRGRFRAPFPFAPAHSQRQSAKSAVRCSLCPEHGRGRQSGSMVVHLEVFTKWARRASPLHRHAPDGSGPACRWRSMGRRCVRLRHHNLR